MSIVRIGLSETKHFSEGYEAIFGKKKPVGQKAPARSSTKKKRPKKKK